jgi:hypothetical protein
MQEVERAVAAVLTLSADHKKEREVFIQALGGLRQDCQEAARVWQGYAAAPGAAGDKFSLMSWVGPARAKQLHEINLKAKDRLHGVAQVLGGSHIAGRTLELDDEVVEMAYRQLKEGETGPQAAQRALEVLESRQKRLAELAEKIRTTPAPAKTAAKTASKAKPKPTKKKAAAKKPAKKKPPKKK